MSITDLCTIDCEARQTCTRCHRRKAPVGRDAPMEMHGSLCDDECPTYRDEPQPGHLWPGELARAKQEPED